MDWTAARLGATTSGITIPMSAVPIPDRKHNQPIEVLATFRDVQGNIQGLQARLGSGKLHDFVPQQNAQTRVLTLTNRDRTASSGSQPLEVRWNQLPSEPPAGVLEIEFRQY